MLYPSRQRRFQDIVNAGVDALLIVHNPLVLLLKLGHSVLRSLLFLECVCNIVLQLLELQI